MIKKLFFHLYFYFCRYGSPITFQLYLFDNENSQPLSTDVEAIQSSFIDANGNTHFQSIIINKLPMVFAYELRY